ncbi:MAG: cytidine deaminase [Flavipsychrobacter sp.]|nr:cytidine deaminase [Flavipsychrobacter sp.]
MDVFSFPYQQYLKDELPEEIKQLVAMAEAACAQAYAPYSQLKVGAAVLMTDGQTITGANQENASYPVGICAERAVLSTINPSDDRKIKAIAVTYTAEDTTQLAPIAPCGMCRQSILEMQHRQGTPITLYMCGPGNEVTMVEDSEFLLPFSFGNKDLPGYKPQG